MPRVPTASEAGLGQQTPQALTIPQQTSRLPHVRVPMDESFRYVSGEQGRALERMGRQLDRAGDDFGRIAIEQQREYNLTAAKEADAAASDRIRALLYDPTEGFLNLRGRDAMDRAPDIRERLEAVRKDVAGKLEPGAAEIFERYWENRRESGLLRIDNHHASEMRRWKDTVNESLLKSALDDAVAAAGDPEMVGQAEGAIRATVEDVGRDNGWTQDIVVQRTKEALTEMHKGVVTTLLNEKQYGRAAAHLREAIADDEISAVVASSLKDKMETARKVAAEESRAARVQSQVDAWTGEGLSTAEMLERSRRLPQKDRDEARKRIRWAAQEREIAEEETHEAARDRATDIIDGGGRPEDIPFSDWTALTTAEQATLESRWRRRVTGTEPVTDEEHFQELLIEAQTDPEAFAKRDLLAMREKLDNGDFETVRKLHAATKAAAKGDPAPADFSVLSQKESIKMMLEAADIETNPKPGSDEAKALAEFHRTLGQRARAFEVQNDREPNQAEVEEMARALLSDVAIRGSEGSFLGLKLTGPDRARVYEVPRGEPTFVPADEIPPGDKALLLEDGRVRGKSLTPGDLEDLYAAYLAGDRARYEAILETAGAADE
jgi:hypothetical protein